MDSDDVRWSRGTTESLRLAGKGSKDLADLLRAGRGPPCKADRDALCVAVNDGYAVASGRNAEGMAGMHVKGSNTIDRIRDTAEDLESFPLNLLLLASDMGYDIVHDVEGRDTGIACTGDGLHCGDESGLERAKGLFKGREGDDDAGGGAVGVGDDEAFLKGGRVGELLLGEDGKMGGVDVWDDEGDVRIAAVVLCVGEDGEIGGAEGSLCDGVSRIGIRGRETDLCRRRRQHRGQKRRLHNRQSVLACIRGRRRRGRVREWGWVASS